LSPSRKIFAARALGPSRSLAVPSLTALCGLLLTGSAYSQDLSSYAVLSGQTITNSGPTTIAGNIGLHPGTAFTGSGSVTILGGALVDYATAEQAKIDLTAAVNGLLSLGSNPLNGVLGGQTLTGGGVYSMASADITGTLTLDGDADDIFVFQIDEALNVATNGRVLLLGDVRPENVFFVVGSSATLGTDASFVGQIYAGASISLGTRATILCGAALAQTGSVTMLSNTISICAFTSDPEDIADILDGDVTENGQSLLDAFQDFVDGGGTLPTSIQLLAVSPELAEAALAQLTGELGTAVAPAGMQGMDSFLSLLRGPNGDSLAVVTGHDQPVDGGTVSVMGYAADPGPAGGEAFYGFDTPQGTTYAGQWTAWLSGYGGESHVDGDDSVGSGDRAITDYGLALGVERQVTNDTMVGFAVSTGGADFSVGDDLGSGRTAMLQAAVYARKAFEKAYVAGALAVGYNRVSTDRFVDFAAAEYNADFDAMNYAGEIEVGYDMGWFTPYAALRGQVFHTPSYSEEAATGSVPLYALDYDANTTMALRTELGARADWQTDFLDDGTLTLHASAAWAHEWRSGEDLTAHLQFMPDSPHRVSGAQASADSVLAEVGAALDLGSGLGFSGTLSGEYSDNAMSYGATAGLSYTW
jgi:uncharacterized protein with beta-barrel porin domain